MKENKLFKENKWVYKILLQVKFFVVEWLNLTYTFVPTPIRRFYLRVFGIRIGRGSCIHRGCRFFHIGNFCIGEMSVVNWGCFIDNRRGIKIGNNVGVAHGVKIYTAGHNINSPKFEPNGKPVIIEDNAFIFSNAMIMPGVTIGNGAIVLAGSVVTKSVPSRKIVGGNPARVLRDRTADIDYNQSYTYWFAL